MMSNRKPIFPALFLLTVSVLGFWLWLGKEVEAEAFLGDQKRIEKRQGRSLESVRIPSTNGQFERPLRGSQLPQQVRTWLDDAVFVSEQILSDPYEVSRKSLFQSQSGDFIRLIEVWRVRVGTESIMVEEASLADWSLESASRIIVDLSRCSHEQRETVFKHFGSSLQNLGNGRRNVRISIDLENVSPSAVDRLSQQVADVAPRAKVEPDHLVFAMYVPDDPRFEEQWALRNTGTVVGTAGSDIRATRAWDAVTDAFDSPVAVIDTGVDLDHVDLVDNLWRNPGEIPANGLDDDANGKIDDIFGWDFYNEDPTPGDEHGHGSHIAGIIGAVGGNAIGVSGVAPRAQIASLRFMGKDASGFASDAVRAIRYANENGFRVLNCSWGLYSPSSLLRDALIEATQAGSLVVCAAGNDGLNIEAIPIYPASYNLPGILCVTSTDARDRADPGANYGGESVDLGAPGRSILSLDKDGGYRYRTGTSMACAHVAGVAALAFSAKSDLGVVELADLIVTSGDALETLVGRSSSGRRLNAARLMAGLSLGVPVSTAPESLVVKAGHGQSIELAPPGAPVSLLSTLPQGFAFDSATNRLSGSAIKDEELVFRFSVQSGGLEIFDIHFLLVNPYYAWSELFNISSPDGDVDGDGVANALEFLLGQDPNSPEASSLFVNNPRFDPSISRFSLEFPSRGVFEQVQGAWISDGLQIDLHSSRDLEEWEKSPLDWRIESSPSADAFKNTLQVYSVNHSSLFFRLIFRPVD
jgi:subtilisin family serine protease